MTIEEDEAMAMPSFLLNRSLDKPHQEESARALKRRLKRERAKASKKPMLETSGKTRTVDDEDDFDDDEPRSFAQSTGSSWTSNKVEKLPVKTGDGSILAQDQLKSLGTSKPISSLVWQPGEKREDKEDTRIPEEDILDESEESDRETKPKKTKAPKEQPENLSAAELLIRREEMKIEISNLSNDIMAEPEEGFKQLKSLSGSSRFKRLLDLCRDPLDTAVQKLSILSLVVVFKDIIPGYKIRLPTALEMKVKVKKEVKALRQFEKGLLDGYQNYLKILHSIITAGIGSNLHYKHVLNKTGDDVPSIVVVALRAMCTVIIAKPHFNFKENVLANVIPQMNSTNGQVRELCCNCISTLLDEDVAGELTLEIVTFVSKYVSSRKNGQGGSIHPDMIRVLLRCTLNADLKDELRAEVAKANKLTKKQKRKKKDEVGLGFEAADAQVDKYQKHAHQIETLRELFTMFLRVLKRAPQALIMPVVLQGVAKYVHLINLDIAQSLISVLTDLIESETMTLETSFHTIITVTKTMQGPGRELNSDESKFMGFLYKLLLRVATSCEDRDKMVLLASKCMDNMFLGRKQYQHNRVASFVLRLAVLSNTVSPHAALAIVATIRSLMHRYASVCRPLLESEAEAGDYGNSIAASLPPPLIGDSGNHDPALLQTDVAVLWPLSMLRFHYHPFLREFAVKALDMAPILPTERPNRLFSAYNPTGGGFNPPIQNSILNQAQKEKYKKLGYEKKKQKQH